VSGAKTETRVAEHAPAKINLYLHVTARRADGYHLLDSLIVFADAGDTIEVEDAGELSLSCDGPFAAALGPPPTNLAFRAARLLAARAGIDARARIRLTKRLPVASGIGGGSADAAAVLRALCRLWGERTAGVDLHDIAAALGADIPVCLHGRPAFIGGIGELIEPAPRLPQAALLLVNPGVALATEKVFKSFTGPHSPAARFAAPPRDAADLAELLATRHNDLTDASIAQVPVIGAVLSALERAPGARLARMSGSGATCFALFDDPETAQAAARELSAAHPGWWVEPAALLSAERQR
jgi:4-diphosphocytidyl-2-C-methyl-D-erythritol kinase